MTFSDEEIKELWRLREQFAGKVGRELDLIGQRMTWLVTSQAFLFTAWVNAKKEVDSNLFALSLVVSTIGLSIALVAYGAICAALRVLARMGTLYLESVEISLGLPPMGANREEPETLRRGNWPALFLPPIFAGIWAGAFANALRGFKWFWLESLGQVVQIRSVLGVDCLASLVGGIVTITCVWNGSRRWTVPKTEHPVERTHLNDLLEKALDFASKAIQQGSHGPRCIHAETPALPPQATSAPGSAAAADDPSG